MADENSKYDWLWTFLVIGFVSFIPALLISKIVELLNRLLFDPTVISIFEKIYFWVIGVDLKAQTIGPLVWFIFIILIYKRYNKTHDVGETFSQIIDDFRNGFRFLIRNFKWSSIIILFIGLALLESAFIATWKTNPLWLLNEGVRWLIGLLKTSASGLSIVGVVFKAIAGIIDGIRKVIFDTILLGAFGFRTATDAATTDILTFFGSNRFFDEKFGTVIATWYGVFTKLGIVLFLTIFYSYLKKMTDYLKIALIKTYNFLPFLESIKLEKVIEAETILLDYDKDTNYIHDIETKLELIKRGEPDDRQRVMDYLIKSIEAHNDEIERELLMEKLRAKYDDKIELGDAIKKMIIAIVKREKEKQKKGLASKVLGSVKRGFKK